MKISFNITERDWQTLALVFHFHVMTTNQMAKCSATPARSQRRRNRILFQAGLLTRCDIPSPFGGSPTPAYAISKDAAHRLAQHFSDEKFIDDFLAMPAKQYVAHAVAVTETHWLLDQSLTDQETVSLSHWLHEGTRCGPDPATNTTPTTVMDFGIPVSTKGRVTCQPDFIASLTANGQSCLFFGEEDRDTYWANKAIARKLPGYQRLFVSQYHLQHLVSVMSPVPSLFRILFIAPTPSRRDALRRQASRLLKKVSSDFQSVWRFVSKSGPQALTAESFLHGDVFFRCDDDQPQPLIAQSPTGDGQPTGCPVSTGQSHGQLETVNANAK